MNYIEKNPLPLCCKECLETNVETCFRCVHFSEKYEMEYALLHELETRDRLIRKLLRVNSDLDYDILFWKPAEKRPAELSYVIIREFDEDLGMTCSTASYEKGRFWYFYPGASAAPVEENTLIGWCYFPYDLHRDGQAEPATKSVFDKLRSLMEDKNKE